MGPMSQEGTWLYVWVSIQESKKHDKLFSKTNNQNPDFTQKYWSPLVISIIWKLQSWFSHKLYMSIFNQNLTENSGIPSPYLFFFFSLQREDWGGRTKRREEKWEIKFY